MTPTPTAAEALAVVIASELAKIDGCDFEELHALRWSGGSAPEPLGDAWSMDYLPKGERIARAIAAHPDAPPAAEGVRKFRDYGFNAGPWTYTNQPGNVGAWGMGIACRKAMEQTAGDPIDRGLILLRELQAEGFGVYAIGVKEPPAPEQAVAWWRVEYLAPPAQSEGAAMPADEAAQVEAPTRVGDFYGNGDTLPRLHPDATTNAEVVIQALCARLDTARQALADAAAMQVVQPVLQSIKANAAWAMHETDPVRFAPRSATYEVTPASAEAVSDEAVEAALSASGDYWTEPEHATTCHVCRGSGTVACGEYSQDGCDNCGGGGVVHSGTEEGAMRSALAAAHPAMVAEIARLREEVEREIAKRGRAEIVLGEWARAYHHVTDAIPLELRDRREHDRGRAGSFAGLAAPRASRGGGRRDQ